MNAFLRAVVRLGLNRDKIAVLGVRDGYRGLVRTARAVNGDAEALIRLKNTIASHPGRAGLINDQLDLIQMDHASVSGIMGKGGTILGSARCLEFHDKEVRTKVIKLLKSLNVRALAGRRRRWFAHRCPFCSPPKAIYASSASRPPLIMTSSSPTWRSAWTPR